MAQDTKKITERERAIVKYAIAYNVKSPSTLYRLAFDGSEQEVNALQSLAPIASRWWKSQKIQTAYKEELAAYQSKLKSISDKALADHLSRTRSADGDLAPGGIIDFTDPENLARELNRIANDANLDDKGRLDALKLIIQTQKDNNTEDGPKSEIHRFYTPLSCQKCALYLEAKQNLK